MMLAGWTIGAAWRTVEILQEGRLMDRMSISALLGAAFSRKKWHKMALKEIVCFDDNTCNIALRFLNLGLRELPICTKICTKASALALLPLCFGSAFVS